MFKNQLNNWYPKFNGSESKQFFYDSFLLKKEWMTRVPVKANCIESGPQLSGSNFIVILNCFLQIWKIGYRTQNYIMNFNFPSYILRVSPLGELTNFLRL